MPASIALILAAFMAAVPAYAQHADTVFIEVGSPAIDGRVFKPHAARVRVYRGDTLTAEWVNRLTLGDSAGRPVMRWVTTSQPIPSNPNRVLSVLRQTYDAVTLAPLGYWSESANGAFTRLRIDGQSARGTRRTATDTTQIPVELAIPRLGFFAGASDLVPVAAGLKTGTVLVAPVWGPGMRAAEDRVFTILADTVVDVEGTPVRSRKVEEYKRSDRTLKATWYLLLTAPYMVYGEVPLPDGRVQRMTEVPEP
ncbi:MAG TPA: hypothetical protein VJ650_15720 [Gemmatimonadaceae bacterium]|nr:hypothetical protein [Gemmatimonadaceae bacterium]